MNTTHITFGGCLWRLTGNGYWMPETNTLRIDAVPAPEYDTPSVKEDKPVSTTKVEKGQKYKGGNGSVYEILSEPFEHGGETKVVFEGPRRHAAISPAYFFAGDNYTLIREPKFKVGDRVVYRHAYNGDTRTVEGVSQGPDVDGDFAYIVKDDDDYFELADEPALKAAE